MPELHLSFEQQVVRTPVPPMTLSTSLQLAITPR
ncbi:unnamed protein product, partial [Rotaria magnacalcarata]